MSSARFQLRNQTQDGEWSAFDDGDFECASGDVIEAKLEDTPALDVWQAIFSCIDRSNGRTIATFAPSDGQADPPTAIVEITIPGEVGAWQIQCQVNGGVAALDSAGRPDATVNTKTRIIVVRTTNLQLRHPLADDIAKDPEHAAVALQEMIDAVDAGGGGGSGASAGPAAHNTLASGGFPIVGVWFFGTRLAADYDLAENSIRLVTTMSIAASDTDYYQVTVAWFEPDGTEHDLVIVTTESTTGYVPGGPILQFVQHTLTHSSATIPSGAMIGIFVTIIAGSPDPTSFSAYL
jgi:hypothetical protein